ncbi:hypothetical protein [Enterococcus alishanensis]
MKDSHEILYKTSENNDSLGFIISGIILLIFAGFLKIVESETIAIVLMLGLALVFFLIGLWMRFKTTKKKIILYKSSLQYGEDVIPLCDIEKISFQKIKIGRTPFYNTYPFIELKNGESFRLNKHFNFIFNREWKRQIDKFFID